MHISSQKKIVLLGMMSQMPVAGVIWQTMHYLIGFRRLGYDVYYVESHARTPTMLMEHESDDSSGRAVQLIESVMRRFDFGHQWAFHALHDDGQCYGMSHGALLRLYRSADAIINLHGGTKPLPEHAETGRLVYLETDPVQLQIELQENNQWTIDFLDAHVAFFTFGENYGQPGCLLPKSDRFDFKPTRQPVVADFWQPYARGDAAVFTTIGNWRQRWRDVRLDGETYSWSKHLEFSKFIDLPQRSGASFELALGQYEPEDQRLLEAASWSVRNALSFTMDIDDYRQYIAASRGEFTVAKDQNVRLRSGWFSDRSATYLAAGRPVITQETGFSSILPTGEGLFGFETMDDVLAAIDNINSNYPKHCRAAEAIGRDYFNYDVVLRDLLDEAGISRPHSLSVR
jgi:hypothetical protein